MTFTEEDYRKMVELSLELKHQDCHPGMTAHFIQHLGIPTDEIIGRGGTLAILSKCVPVPYPTYTDLVRAIKSSSPS